MSNQKKEHVITITLHIKAKDKTEAVLKAGNFIRYGIEETASIIPPSGLTAMYLDGVKQRL